MVRWIISKAKACSHSVVSDVVLKRITYKRNIVLLQLVLPTFLRSLVDWQLIAYHMTYDESTFKELDVTQSSKVGIENGEILR